MGNGRQEKRKADCSNETRFPSQSSKENVNSTGLQI